MDDMHAKIETAVEHVKVKTERCRETLSEMCDGVRSEADSVATECRDAGEYADRAVGELDDLENDLIETVKSAVEDAIYDACADLRSTMENASSSAYRAACGAEEGVAVCNMEETIMRRLERVDETVDEIATPWTPRERFDALIAKRDPVAMELLHNLGWDGVRARMGMSESEKEHARVVEENRLIREQEDRIEEAVDKGAEIARQVAAEFVKDAEITVVIPPEPEDKPVMRKWASDVVEETPTNGDGAMPVDPNFARPM